jgi:DTW domain-containing protein
MSSRPDVRCTTCLLHTALCICSLVPQLETRTRLTLMVHFREARKPSNTGQLAARCVTRSAVEVVGKRGAQPVVPVVGNELPLLMFPADDAVPIERYAGSDIPIALFVPDGHWHQASKIRPRGPRFDAIQCVTLADSSPSEYRLRTEPRAGGLATLEAIARALRVLEGPRGPEIERAMLGVFRVMVERTLWFRGKLRDEEVTGGIPAAARERDPRGAVTRQMAARSL